MATILQMAYPNEFVQWIISKFRLNFWNGPYKNSPAVVQILTWPTTGVKPSSEPKMALLADAYKGHLRSMI